MSGVVSTGEEVADSFKEQRILELAVADIIVPEDRVRSVDSAWVEALARVIEAQGLINPITVREVEGKPILVSGLHRLEAFKVLGRGTISARMSKTANDDEARLEEVLENLARNELIALDRCHHLYELKQVYERLHPEVRYGGDRKSETIKVQFLHFDNDDKKEPELFGFAETVAAQVGLSRHSIFSAISI